MRAPAICASVIALLIACTGGAFAASTDEPTAEAPSDPGRDACDYGIAVAFNGDLARAESSFVRLLAESPGDPRALTNLGNLSLMRGEPEVALKFYERAAAADTADAGILLNEATALLLLGDDEAAAERAALGTERAGGVREAARLLGLQAGSDVGTPKAAPNARVSQEEILNLLRSAATGVPSDSLRATGSALGQAGSKETSAGHRRAPVWRSAAARAGDKDVATVLYWKR